MIHWRFGGSTAERTLHCPGWRKESDKRPPLPTSEFAQYGTALHAVMEEVLIADDREVIIEDMLGVTWEGVQLEEHHQQKAIDALRAFEELEEVHGMYEYEPECGAEYAHDVGGHADFVGLSRDKKTVFVGDYKFGDGIQVFPTENAQALFYGMVMRAGSTVADMFDQAERFVAVIIQPNDRDLPTLRMWETSITTLDKFETDFNHSLRLAQSDDPPLQAGKWCKFCAASPVCPQRTGEAHRALLMSPQDLELLGENLALVGKLREWCVAIENAAEEQLKQGAQIAGYKLVAKRAVRRWALDDDTIYKKLARKLGGKKAMTNTAIISPAQAEKLAKQKGVDLDLGDLVIQTSTGQSVAHEDDKRPALPAPQALAAALANAGINAKQQ